MSDSISKSQEFWDSHAKTDPLWAILSDPSKVGRGWNLQEFMATGRREVSLLMYQIRALSLSVDRAAALDFGCGVGRLTQPLAQYFESVIGVDVSPEMIRLAEQINSNPDRVRYVCNVRPDLSVFAANQFTFMYSNVVLQHIEPAATLNYLRELIRVVATDGLLVFQLPSHERPPEERTQLPRPMPIEAYRASIDVQSDSLDAVVPGEEIVLVATVTNVSGQRWSQPDVGTIRLGNHWLLGERDEMLIQDDGRTPLPDELAPGETCRLSLRVVAPTEPGEYQLQCDLVHEGISWFGDKGSSVWTSSLRVAGHSANPPMDLQSRSMSTVEELSLSDYLSAPPTRDLPMFGVHCDTVAALVSEQGAHVVHREIDERCGQEWLGYRYFVRKN